MEQHPQLTPQHMALFAPLLTPVLYENKGNIPALVRYAAEEGKQWNQSPGQIILPTIPPSNFLGLGCQNREVQKKTFGGFLGKGDLVMAPVDENPPFVPQVILDLNTM